MIASNCTYLWLGAVVLGALLLTNFTSYFSAEARSRKRRRKSYGHVVTNVRRPMVRFSVRTR